MLIRIYSGLLFSVITFHALAAADCNQLKGCERKFCEIENQLAFAQEQKQSYKVSGLKKSLKNARKNCTNESLRDDVVRKIEDSNADIAEYESALQAAEKNGKAKKAAKYKNKIDKEKIEIKNLESELSYLE
jgi:hypothetical protein